MKTPEELLKEKKLRELNNWYEKKVKELEGEKEEEEKSLMTETFTCSNCYREQEIKNLAKEVKILDSDPIKTCSECYNFYHNSNQVKPKNQLFTCDYCRYEIIGIRFHRKVSVSMPNELGLINGKTYDFCFSCNPKVKEYNEHEDFGERELEE